VPGLAEGLHELTVWHGFGGGHVDDAVGFVGDLGLGEQEVGGAAVVEVVHPGDELFAGALGAAEAEAGEFGEDAACVGTHDHGGAETDLAGVRGWDGGQGLFPAVGYVDGEGPGFGEVGGFVGAALAG